MIHGLLYTQDSMHDHYEKCKNIKMDLNRRGTVAMVKFGLSPKASNQLVVGIRTCSFFTCSGWEAKDDCDETTKERRK